MAASAEIQWYDRNRDGYVEYFIKVVYNGRQWSIKKRYNEFAVLNEYLIKNQCEVPFPLPAKHPWRRRDDKMLKLRRKELQSYLDGLLGCHSLSGNRFLKEFLEIDVGMLGLTRMKTQKAIGLRVLDNLRIAPDEFAAAVIKFNPKSRAAQSPTFGNISPFKTSFSHLQGPLLRKSKSLSFSNSFTNRLMRGESFVGESSTTASSSSSGPRERERKTSVEYLLSASGISSSSESKVLAKKKAFISATNAIWSHYSEEMSNRCRRMDAYTDKVSGGDDLELTALDEEAANLWGAVELALQPIIADPIMDIIQKYPVESVLLPQFTVYKPPPRRAPLSVIRSQTPPDSPNIKRTPSLRDPGTPPRATSAQKPAVKFSYIAEC